MTGALFETHGAAGTAVVIETVAIAFAEFDHGTFGTSTVTAVTFETIAARQTAHGFVPRFLFG
jgi:hypothetical protein